MATIAEQLTSLANTKTAIKDAIVAKGVTVADTDPFSAYPDKIGQISGGGAPATKFGVSIDSLLGNVDENGGLQTPDIYSEFDGSGITTLHATALYQRFNGAKISRVSFPDLVLIEEQGGYYTFSGAGVESVDLSNLTTVNGSYACQYMFGYCRVPSVDLSNLTTVNGSYACNNMFAEAPVVSVNLSKLTTVNGNFSCVQMFKGSKCSRVDFPALTNVSPENAFGTGSFNAVFASNTALTEIHFRADAQAMIESLSGYASKFGATNASIIFDL